MLDLPSNLVRRALTVRVARLPTRFRRLGLCDGACRSLDAARTHHIGRDSLDYVHRTRNWHQTGTSQTQKAKKSAGANLLTLDLLGSPTWTRTRDLRINSQYKPDFLGRYGTSWDEIKTF